LTKHTKKSCSVATAGIKEMESACWKSLSRQIGF
jgi:hypothetical protein